MKKSTTIKSRLAKCLKDIASRLEGKGSIADKKLKFVDLAPTDEADQDGVYSEAFRFAINNAKVFNIALTGPYGSGKSSIIQSFLKKYRKPSLHISLASFVAEADSGAKKVSRQEIERSILQQMLYGADANKLPLSRFKRIQAPGFWSFLKSLYIMLGILALWYVFKQREEMLSGSFLLPFSLSGWLNNDPFLLPFSLSSWLNLGGALLAGSFLWVTLHHFYVASFGLSLKSISLKDVEIKPVNDDQESILNRHLDEIIYFFQSTNYDLVVIEDLDRFNDPDIFVTLREINSLVNENAGVKSTVRFLYALRDDMFASAERTKFFEFIVPVIPIINTSNSIDMVLQQGARLALDERLDRQFLREVSRYLNDLRLIQNIFNEYAIYVSNLEKDNENLLDANKLLSVLIYKNVYPRDFEQLHRGEGNLATILSIQDELIATGEAAYRVDITNLENQLEAGESQVALDLVELRKIHAMALIEKLPADASSVSFNQPTWISITNLARSDVFEQLIDASHFHYKNSHHNYPNYFDLSTWQSEVNLQKPYQQRKEDVESRRADNKSYIFRQIHDLRQRISELRMTKLNELLRLNSGRVNDLFGGFGENGELARFLILEGYLDDTYYQYTSLFHSGRLSPNDNKFLIQIRAFATPEPSFPIDNPKEVIAAMREEDFSQSYVLNVKLVDSLLNEQSLYIGQTQKLFEFLSSNFENSEDFFDAYYSSGSNIAGLLKGLGNTWKGFIPAVIASHNNSSHTSQLLASLPKSMLKELGKSFNELPKFVSENLSGILANLQGLEPERLACLGFEVKDLAAIKEHAGIVRFMFEKGLFELTIPNMEYAYQVILGESDLELFQKKNFTTLRSMSNTILLDRVEREFDCYLRDILLQLQDNSEEDESALLAVICRDELDLDDLQMFLKQQTTLLPTLEDIPDRLHVMLINLGMIKPTWVNCLTFMEGEGFEADMLSGYLDRDVVRTTILESPIPSDDASFPLRRFLYNAGSLSDTAYREYARALPRIFQEPPEGFESDKLRILIEEGKITLSKESLDALADNWDLQVLFVASNIDVYLADTDSFRLDDDFLEDLIRSDIDHSAKQQVVELMDLGELENNTQRAGLIGQVIQNARIEKLELDAEVVRLIIENSDPVETQITLLNKYHAELNDDEVRQTLLNLPKPFSDIKTGWSAPKLEKTSENQQLVTWLDSRDIISSWSDDRFFNDKIKVNLYRG